MVYKLLKKNKYFLLLCTTFALYAPTLQADFQFDDNVYILESQEVRNPIECVKTLFHHFFRPDRSLVTLSFAVNHSIHSYSVSGYHLINILFHSLNGILVFNLLFQVVGKGKNSKKERYVKIAALAGAFLFLIHPVAVHSVTYITQRHGLMATFFYFTGFLSFIKARDSEGTKRAMCFLLLIVSFWCAVHSKPMTLTFPLVLIAYELLLIRRKICVKRLISLTAMALLLVATMLVAYAIQSGLFTKNAPLAGFTSQHLWSSWENVLTQSIVFLHYWKILFLPLQAWISADHYYPIIHLLSPAVIGSWLVHIMVLGIGIRSYIVGMPLITFGISWFYITLSPYFILPIQDVMVDYKTYLASFGFVCILAEVGRHIVKEYSSRFAIIGLVVLGCFWCYGTIERNKVFITQETFWTDIIHKYPSEARPYNNRGLAYHSKGEYERAIAEFKKAIELSPNLGLVYANIGDSYREIGNITKAIEHYNQYIKLRPDDADGLVRMANVYARQGDWVDAVNFYEKAVKTDSKNLGALYNLGLGLGHLSKYDQALNIFKKVASEQPSNAKALAAIGAIHYQQGDKSQAKDFFVKALAIDPLLPDALNNLAVYFIGMGQMLEARELALRLKQVDSLRGQRLIDLLSTAK